MMYGSWDIVHDGQTDGWMDRDGQMDGQTDGQKKWHIEVGAPPNKNGAKDMINSIHRFHSI